MLTGKDLCLFVGLFLFVCLFVFVFGFCLFVCSISNLYLCTFPPPRKNATCVASFPCVTSHRRKAFAEGVEGGIEGSINGFKKSHKH